LTCASSAGAAFDPVERREEQTSDLVVSVEYRLEMASTSHPVYLRPAATSMVVP
jgi:hypothetical protein